MNYAKACVPLEHGRTPRSQRRHSGYRQRPRRHSRPELASLKGEAHSWLRDPNYDTLKLRLEAAHSAAEAAAVEARRRVRLNEGRQLACADAQRP